MILLEMSISASVLIVLLVLVRATGFWKLPKRIFRLLWLVVLARLLVPVSIPMPAGIAAPALRMLHRMVFEINRGNIEFNNMPETSFSGLLKENTEILGQDDKIDGLSDLSAVWMAGLAGFGIYFLYFFRKEYRLLAQALPLEFLQKKQLMELPEVSERLGKTGILTHDRIFSPLVWGIFRQRIVLPKEMVPLGQEQMEYVLMHEMIHIMRRDNFWKLLSVAAVCIHWFNPLVWMMYFLFSRDLELSCDERVISQYGNKCRKEYAMTILTLMQNQKSWTVFCSQFGKNLERERIEAIMKYKKLTKAGMICTVMLLAGAATVFASNIPETYAGSNEEMNQKSEKPKDENESDEIQNESQDSDMIYENTNGDEQTEKKTPGRGEVKRTEYVITDNNEQKDGKEEVNSAEIENFASNIPETYAGSNEEMNQKSEKPKDENESDEIQNESQDSDMIYENTNGDEQPEKKMPGKGEVKRTEYVIADNNEQKDGKEEVNSAEIEKIEVTEEEGAENAEKAEKYQVNILVGKNDVIYEKDCDDVVTESGNQTTYVTIDGKQYRIEKYVLEKKK